ncbi:MAG TPA: site-specific DNA-methyltransferase [Pyrinomonadaceae bacterium]|jgi:adenine-specific DNA-methyltransferase|nr:site-specific DNA-methyltransferase [Pyrinomonadaceae bacterium]
MAKNNYIDYSPEQLREKIRQLEKKRYGLVWEDKPEDVADRCDRELPVLVHQEGKEIADDPGGPNNLLIEGDNYHALFALNFTHRRKVDVIYIDPPYNTGARDWKYNNDYVDINDRYRHSKWLSMMSKRLRLAKNLLREDGVICVTIDDYEFARLNTLLDEVFGETNHLGTVVIRNNPAGRSTVRGFAVAHEYALFFARSEKASISRLERTAKQIARYKEKDEVGAFEWGNFRKHGGSTTYRTERPRQFYPIYVGGNNIRVPSLDWDEDQRSWNVLDEPKPSEEVLWPIDSKGNERVWSFGHETTRTILHELRVSPDSEGKTALYRRWRLNEEGRLPHTWWDRREYSAAAYGTNLLKNIFGTSQSFSYPKSLFAVIDCLKVASSKRDAVILDFFAGSATTAQAVLEMNRQDGGSRRFIVCTNNENNIAEEVCYERIRRVIGGNPGFDTSKQLLLETKLTLTVLKDLDEVFDNIEQLKNSLAPTFHKFEVKSEDQYLRVYGIFTDSDPKRPANLKYFSTDFVPNIMTDNDKRILVSRSTELLCIAEDTFDELSCKEQQYAIFRNAKRSTAIIYDEDWIDSCVDELNRLKPSGTATVYVFSYDQDYDQRDFAELSIKFKVKPIPEAILNVYRRNARLRKK